MPARLKQLYQSLTLSQKFMLASLVILILGMLGLAAWVEQQIVTGVIHRTGVTTALYVDSVVAPNLQGLGQAEALSPQEIDALSTLMQQTALGQHIVALKVWNTRGKLLYTTDLTSVVGRSYPMHEGYLRARLGEVFSEYSSLDEEENQALGASYTHLIETYSPVWLAGTDRIIAVAEFYQSTEDFDREIAALKRQSWLVVGLALLVIYLLLAGFVKRASDTISQQKNELAEKVDQLTRLLAQNKILDGRVRRAAASVVQLNEDYLHRIGAELHDGPAQDLGLGLLKLDAFIGQLEKKPGTASETVIIEQLSSIQGSLENGLKEMRAIAAGLSLPQLVELNLSDTVARVVKTHERRTATLVALEIDPVPEDVPLAVKITIYRLVQEALNNAYRHAGGVGQRVRLYENSDQIGVEIADSGPGFDPQAARAAGGRLGLSGMRERVESLGGSFIIESQSGKGTTILALLPCKVEEGGPR